MKAQFAKRGRLLFGLDRKTHARKAVARRLNVRRTDHRRGLWAIMDPDQKELVAVADNWDNAVDYMKREGFVPSIESGDGPENLVVA